MEDQVEDQAVVSSEGGIPFRLIVGAAVAILLGVFVFQNTHEVEVHFLWMDGTPPLFLMLLVTLVSGVVLTGIVTWYRHRRS